MTSLLHCYLVLVIWKFGGAFTFSGVLTTTLSTSSVSYDSLWNADFISSCSPGGIDVPGKSRVRNLICLPDLSAAPTTELHFPEIPSLAEIQNVLSNTTQKHAPDRKSIRIIYLNGTSMATSDPNFYCASYAEESYNITFAVQETSGSVLIPPYYSQLKTQNCVGLSTTICCFSNVNMRRLRSESSVEPLYSAWKCLETEIFLLRITGSVL